MTNEAIGYQDFRDRFEQCVPWQFGPNERERVVGLAWEECAWIATLTDERGRRAIEDAAKTVSEELGR